MKQGTTLFMNIRVGMDLDLIESAKFKFVQGDKVKTFMYPSEKSQRNDSCRSITLLWSESDTWIFKANETIAMDTKITLKDSRVNPDTPIKYFKLHETLFEEGE